MERRFPDGFQHDTTRITAITPSGDPLGLEKGLDIPAGNLCALSGVDDSLYKSGFITTSEPNAIMASRFFQTYVDQAKPPSVLRVIIYPSQPDDTRTLLTAMQNVLRTDLASECYLTDSGDIVLTAVTTNHLQRCLTRLQIHLQPDIPYRVSDPFVFYTKRPSRPVPIKRCWSSHRTNTFDSIAQPSHLTLDFFKNGSHLC